MSNIGKMRNRIAVVAWESTTTDAGGDTQEISDTWQLSAKVEDRQGSASFIHDQRQDSYDYKITVRSYPSKPVSTNNTLIYRNNSLSIESVQNVSEGRFTYLVMRCKITGTVEISSGGGGGGGIVTINYLQGIISTPLAKFITLTIEFPQASGSFNIFCDKTFKVDWGDGVVRQYPDNCLVDWSGFASSGITYFKIYHEDNVERMLIGAISHLYARTAYGDYPVGLKRLDMTGCRLLEAFTLPLFINDLNLQANALPVSEMDSFMAQLNANGITNGKIDGRLQTPSALFTRNADFDGLLSKNWQILEGDI